MLVIGLLIIWVLIVFIGMVYEVLAESSVATKDPAPGQIVAVNGRNMRIQCLGEGRSTIILIRRGKVNKPIEFGHKVWLGEVEGGFIAQYHILDSNPADEQQWAPTLARHVDLFGHSPWQASANRRVHSADNGQFAHKLVSNVSFCLNPAKSLRPDDNMNVNAGSGAVVAFMRGSKDALASSPANMAWIAAVIQAGKASIAWLAGV